MGHQCDVRCVGSTPQNHRATRKHYIIFINLSSRIGFTLARILKEHLPRTVLWICNCDQKNTKVLPNIRCNFYSPLQFSLPQNQQTLCGRPWLRCAQSDEQSRHQRLQRHRSVLWTKAFRVKRQSSMKRPNTRRANDFHTGDIIRESYGIMPDFAIVRRRCNEHLRGDSNDNSICKSSENKIISEPQRNLLPSKCRRQSTTWGFFITPWINTFWQVDSFAVDISSATVCFEGVRKNWRGITLILLWNYGKWVYLAIRYCKSQTL